MAKTNITEYSATPSSNTDINNINIDENCPASGLNNAIRELMAHLKNVDTGSQALTALSVTGNATVNDGITVTDSGASPIIANRTTSDGTIVDLQKDGSTVGSIGTASGVTQYSGSSYASFGAGDVGLFANPNSDGLYPVIQTSLNGRDNAIDLGTSGVRFKDLYLSGGVYLGGTGSANYLDDYEEGTWTPIIRGSSSAGTGTYTTQQGTYTKIGNVVKFQAEITWTSHTGTGQLEVRNYPFTSTNEISPISLRFEGGPTFSSGSYVQAFVNPNSTTSGTAQTNPSTSAYTSVVISNTGTVIVNGVYKTS